MNSSPPSWLRQRTHPRGSPLPEVTGKSEPERGFPVGTLSALGRLLREEQPAQVSALMAEYPEVSLWLEAVKVLGAAGQEGEQAASGSEARDEPLYEALVRVARLGLSAADRRAERLLATLPWRVRVAKRVKLSGAIISAVSSAGVVSALALAQPTAALTSACLGFVTSVMALVGEHMESPIFGPRKSLGDVLSDALSIEREVKDAEVALLEALDSRDIAAAAKLARTVNEIAARLRAIEVIEGIKAVNRSSPAEN